ncbi:MAG: molybdate ABC transporter substrate-binding protein [Saccharospirillum sp.]
MFGLTVVLLAGTLQAAEPIRIAVAANFNGTLQKLTALYESQFDQAFIVSAGSSGALFAQIQQAAPFDVFFSADAARPQRLVADGLALDDSRMTYALGVPVLWSPDPDQVDDQGRVLLTGEFRHLSLAEPRNAPYGVAAQEVLTALGVWESLADERRLVRAQSIGQAYSQVASGAAPMGFVALAQVMGEDGSVPGSFWIPPDDYYSPIVQQAVILTNAGQEPQRLAAARAFMTWMRSDVASALIESAGYGVE